MELTVLKNFNTDWNYYAGFQELNNLKDILFHPSQAVKITAKFSDTL